MTARYSLRSTSRSSRAKNSRIAVWSFERGVPPSPNMLPYYQTDVRVSTINLHKPAKPTTHPTPQAPPRLPLPSPSVRPSVPPLRTKRRRRRLPTQPMPVNAVLALEPHDDHRRCGCSDGVRDRGLESGAVGHRGIDKPVKPRHLRKIQAQRRHEQLLENVLVLCLRQEA